MPELLPPPATPWNRALWALVLLGAGVAAVGCLGVMLSRISYPHELEWMEGAMVDHAARIAVGQPLYCAPSPEHVPFLYAPLLFWLGGLGIAMGMPGLLAVRGVAALASFGVAMLVGHWVRRETGRLVPGLAASGTFLAGYGWLWWWYDLARNDSLFLLATLGCAYCLRHGGPRRWLPAAGLAVLALLAKQSAVMWLPAIGVGALLHDWRNALRWGVATALAGGGALGWLHFASDGWSTFYLFDMPRHHAIDGSRKLGFWTEDILPILPLLLLGGAGFVAGWRRGERGPALLLAAIGSGGLAASWASRLHVGGFDNVLMYAFAAACVLGPAAARRAGRGLATAVPLLLLGQLLVFAGYAYHRSPQRTAMPSPAHTAAHAALRAFVAAEPRGVLLPGHGGITAAAGKGANAHGQAIFDLLQLLPRQPDGMFDLGALADARRLAHLSPRGQQALLAYRDGMLQGLQQQRWSAILLDQQIEAPFAVLFAFGLAGPDGAIGTPDDFYRRQPEPLLPDGAALNPLLGFEVHSPILWRATH